MLTNQPFLNFSGARGVDLLLAALGAQPACAISDLAESGRGTRRLEIELLEDTAAIWLWTAPVPARTWRTGLRRCDPACQQQAHSDDTAPRTCPPRRNEPSHLKVMTARAILIEQAG